MLIYVLSTVAVLFLSRFLWRRWRYDLHKVPSPPGLPFLGQTLDFFRQKGRKQMVLYFGEKFKLLGRPKFMRVDIMGRCILLVTDQKFIRTVIMSKTQPFPRFIERTAIGDHLLLTEPKLKSLVQIAGASPYIKAIRRVYATAMQSANLKKAMPDILRLMDTAIDLIEQGRKVGPVKLAEFLTRLTMDVIGVLAFETNMGGLDGSRDIHRLFMTTKLTAMEVLSNPISALVMKLVPWSRRAREITKSGQALFDEYAKLIQLFQEREDPPENEDPMWYSLKTLKDPETGEVISSRTLLAEVAMIVFSGMETTAQQLEWILILLASYPRVTEKLLNELRDHGLYGSDTKEVTFEVLGSLEYLTAIIKEGMRISYSLSGIFLRVVPDDMDILGYRIPKGAVVNIPGTCAYSTEEEWGDPQVFRPERWLTGEDMSGKFNVAFSVGPRDCLGQRLALLEMKLMIMKLVTRYELALEGDWKSIFDNAKDVLLIEPRNLVQFQMTPREVSSHEESTEGMC